MEIINPKYLALGQSEYLQELLLELSETGRALLLQHIETAKTEAEKIQTMAEAIGQLQEELDATNHGLLALTVELMQAKEKYSNILEHANEAIVTINEESLLETFNPASLILFGYSEDELAGSPIETLIPGFNHIKENRGATDDTKETLVYGCRKNGQHFPVEVTIGEPFYNEQKSWISIIRDISKRIEAEQGLRLMSRIFEESNDGIMVTDTDANIIDVNLAFTLITGYRKDEVIGKNPRMLKSEVHPPRFYKSMWKTLLESGKWHGEVWDKRKNGDIYPKWLAINAVKGNQGEVSHFVGIFTDITARKDAENKLKQLAHYDSLTGLPNRALFLEKLSWAINLARRDKRKMVLFFLDLDRFKLVNDTMGHQVGDQLLVEVAKRLLTCVRKSDMVARLAGDEFTIVLTGIDTLDKVMTIAQKVLAAFAPPVQLSGHELFITTSIGITTFPDDGDDAEKLLKNADTAMYFAKSQGKNSYQFYSDFMNQRVNDELELEINLRKALENNEFLLYYQPQIELASGKIMGAEVLIRWKHPVLGFIPPAQFIPYAERNELILPIGYWVLRTACEQYMAWQNQGLQAFLLSVNYSGMQLKQNNQIALISGVLQETGMSPNNLKLELTEGVVMEDAENIVSTLYEFKKMGISFSIDDFGTGYSSLSYLKRFPIDSLKIDRSFVQDIASNADDHAIAATIIAMAHSLRLSVIAEGVETKEQLEILRALACDQIQGYYYFKPMPAAEFKKLLAASACYHDRLESLPASLSAASQAQPVADTGGFFQYLP